MPASPATRFHSHEIRRTIGYFLLAGDYNIARDYFITEMRCQKFPCRARATYEMLFEMSLNSRATDISYCEGHDDMTMPLAIFDDDFA